MSAENSQSHQVLEMASAADAKIKLYKGIVRTDLNLRLIGHGEKKLKAGDGSDKAGSILVSVFSIFYGNDKFLQIIEGGILAGRKRPRQKQDINTITQTLNLNNQFLVHSTGTCTFIRRDLFSLHVQLSLIEDFSSLQRLTGILFPGVVREVGAVGSHGPVIQTPPVSGYRYFPPPSVSSHKAGFVFAHVYPQAAWEARTPGRSDAPRRKAAAGQKPLSAKNSLSALLNYPIVVKAREQVVLVPNLKSARNTSPCTTSFLLVSCPIATILHCQVKLSVASSFRSILIPFLPTLSAMALRIRLPAAAAVADPQDSQDEMDADADADATVVGDGQDDDGSGGDEEEESSDDDEESSSEEEDSQEDEGEEEDEDEEELPEGIAIPVKRRRKSKKKGSKKKQKISQPEPEPDHDEAPPPREIEVKIAVFTSEQMKKAKSSRGAAAADVFSISSLSGNEYEKWLSCCSVGW
ncbi:hypothetical protein R3P38DRAFT_3444507 [Favolaschia claudopus]|uniref:Uncharacterized protein n=1 Tax=Favolaschia claudopus TaxID=2862362 RepID=A0AAV9ZPU1_9AGAR